MKLPHIGWCRVRAAAAPLHPLFAPLDGEYVYFAHSYAAPADAAGRPARGRPRPRPTAPASRRENLFAVQFHPEKSQRVGLGFLRRFVGI